MIPAEKQEEFNKLKLKATYLKNSSNSEALTELVDYIEQTNLPVPIFHVDFAANRYLIYDLFRLPMYWDTFEERLIIFLKNTIWSELSYQTIYMPYCPYLFVRYVAMSNYRMYSSDAMYKSWIDILIKYGISESDIWLAVHDEGCLNIFEDLGAYVLNNADKYLSISLHNYCHSEYFIAYLIANKPELIDKHLHKFIKGVSINGEFIKCINDTLKTYLSTNPEKHEVYLVSLLSFKNSENNYKTVINLIGLITSNYPNKYFNEINLCFKTHFDLVLNSSNQIDATTFIEFLDLLLACNLPENALKISAKYLNKFKHPNSKSVKTWLKKLKIYELSI